MSPRSYKPTHIAHIAGYISLLITQDFSKSLIDLDPTLIAWTVSEENEFLYRCVREQVPVTARGGARTKSAINNTQASGYVRA